MARMGIQAGLSLQPLGAHDCECWTCKSGMTQAHAPLTAPPRCPVPRAQGTWVCSLRGDCSWTVFTDDAISVIEVLRVLRVFRIIWIIKHFRTFRVHTVLGSLMVRAMAAAALLRLRWGRACVL